jgi:hypothetical protein
MVARDDRYVSSVTAIVDDTNVAVSEHGIHHFLLPYSKRGPFRDPRGRSLFVDGELAMMLAVREIIDPSARGRAELGRYVELIERQIHDGPILCGESYPDECWTFCNTTALAALRVADVTLGTDHRGLAARWVAAAKAHLIDPKTGLLASSYTYDGVILDGPEGSSSWMSAHNLQLIDPDLARDQYDRARQHLGVTVLGFGYAREWPRGGGIADIDSGPIIPILGASPGSSGLAVLGAAAFGDRGYFNDLLRSLELVAAPSFGQGQLRYAAAGPMGDAVILYAHEVGPLWTHVARELQ